MRQIFFFFSIASVIILTSCDLTERLFTSNYFEELDAPAALEIDPEELENLSDTEKKEQAIEYADIINSPYSTRIIGVLQEDPEVKDAVVNMFNQVLKSYRLMPLSSESAAMSAGQYIVSDTVSLEFQNIALALAVIELKTTGAEELIGNASGLIVNIVDEKISLGQGGAAMVKDLLSSLYVSTGESLLKEKALLKQKLGGLVRAGRAYAFFGEITSESGVTLLTADDGFNIFISGVVQNVVEGSVNAFSTEPVDTQRSVILDQLSAYITDSGGSVPDLNVQAPADGSSDVAVLLQAAMGENVYRAFQYTGFDLKAFKLGES